MLMKTPAGALPALPGFVRAAGGVRMTIGATARGSAPIAVAESGGYRVRFPNAGGLCEGVLINTGGGMAGGDRMSVAVSLGEGARATLTTQAAEKIYRSDGADTEIAVDLALPPWSRLVWLPQEQILFDGARLRRRLDVALAPAAELTLVESVVFGRAAMGEIVATGSFRDRWRIRRGGSLVFAEDVRLEGPLQERLGQAALGGGARALATVLHVSDEAEARREEARAALASASSECGLSALNGMLVARFRSPAPQALRADLIRFLERFRGAPMPRSWQS
jgi:urease accessory protein